MSPAGAYDIAALPDRSDAIALVRQAFEIGIDFFDPAERHGPFTNERLLGEALHPVRGRL